MAAAAARPAPLESDEPPEPASPEVYRLDRIAGDFATLQAAVAEGTAHPEPPTPDVVRGWREVLAALVAEAREVVPEDELAIALQSDLYLKLARVDAAIPEPLATLEDVKGLIERGLKIRAKLFRSPDLPPKAELAAALAEVRALTQAAATLRPDPEAEDAHARLRQFMAEFRVSLAEWRAAAEKRAPPAAGAEAPEGFATAPDLVRLIERAQELQARAFRSHVVRSVELARKQECVAAYDSLARDVAAVRPPDAPGAREGWHLLQRLVEGVGLQCNRMRAWLTDWFARREVTSEAIEELLVRARAIRGTRIKAYIPEDEVEAESVRLGLITEADAWLKSCAAIRPADDEGSQRAWTELEEFELDLRNGMRGLESYLAAQRARSSGVPPPPPAEKPK